MRTNTPCRNTFPFHGADFLFSALETLGFEFSDRNKKPTRFGVLRVPRNDQGCNGTPRNRKPPPPNETADAEGAVDTELLCNAAHGDEEGE